MSKSLRCMAPIGALMLVYGTATAKDYRWSCTYSDKASRAGIETDAHLHLNFVFDDVARKGMVFGTNGSDVEVHIGTAVQTTLISFTGDSTHSRYTLWAIRTWCRVNITDSVQRNRSTDGRAARSSAAPANSIFTREFLNLSWRRQEIREFLFFPGLPDLATE